MAVKLLELNRGALSDYLMTLASDNPCFTFVASTNNTHNVDVVIGTPLDELEVVIASIGTGEVSNEEGHDGHRDALWIVSSLERRQATFLSVYQLVALQQAEYLAGNADMPTKLDCGDIAMQIGMHESTIRRILQNKIVATRLGKMSALALVGHDEVRSMTLS